MSCQGTSAKVHNRGEYVGRMMRRRVAGCPNLKFDPRNFLISHNLRHTYLPFSLRIPNSQMNTNINDDNTWTTLTQ